MAEGNKALVRRWLDEVLSQGNLWRVDELFAPNYVLHDPSFPQEVHGREGIRRYVAASRAAYPDACFVIEDQIAERDMVATRWTARRAPTGGVCGDTAHRLPGDGDRDRVRSHRRWQDRRCVGELPPLRRQRTRPRAG